MSTPRSIFDTLGEGSPELSLPIPRLGRLDTAATTLECSTKTVRRYIADGRLTGYRMGPRLIRVDMNEVDALLSRIPTTEAN